MITYPTITYLSQKEIMRYYNENPQVTCLLDKIEEQEKLIKSMKLEVKEARDMCGRCLRFASNFNHLPWYKKMFFKFKL